MLSSDEQFKNTFSAIKENLRIQYEKSKRQTEILKCEDRLTALIRCKADEDEWNKVQKQERVLRTKMPFTPLMIEELLEKNPEILRRRTLEIQREWAEEDRQKQQLKEKNNKELLAKVRAEIEENKEQKGLLKGLRAWLGIR